MVQKAHLWSADTPGSLWSAEDTLSFRGVGTQTRRRRRVGHRGRTGRVSAPPGRAPSPGPAPRCPARCCRRVCAPPRRVLQTRLHFGLQTRLPPPSTPPPPTPRRGYVKGVNNAAPQRRVYQNRPTPNPSENLHPLTTGTRRSLISRTQTLCFPHQVRVATASNLYCHPKYCRALCRLRFHLPTPFPTFPAFVGGLPTRR